MTVSQSLPSVRDSHLPCPVYQKIPVPAVGHEQHKNRYLVVSPYTESDHLLDLQSLNMENRLLALALSNMKCLRDDYATAPYLDTFNWTEVIAALRVLAVELNHTWKETSFFVVAFRSQIPPTTVYAELGTLDRAAHAEATASGGFLKYDPQSREGPKKPLQLTLAPDIGSVHQTQTVAIWPPAYGGLKKTQEKEEQVPLTEKQQGRRGPSIRFGRLTGID